MALGVAVFSGMLGVTAFGIFFTPVFYVVVRWFTEGKTPPAPAPAYAPSEAHLGGEVQVGNGDGNGDAVIAADPSRPMP